MKYELSYVNFILCYPLTPKALFWFTRMVSNTQRLDKKSLDY